jgi:hypothetical protein
MSSIQVMKGPLDDERRGEALFGGDVLIFKDVAPLRRLSTLAGELLRAVFGEAPAHAQFALGPEEFAARASALVERWRRHPAAVEGFREVLRDVGVELDRGYWDRRHLRIQPHQDFTETGTLGYHRDTWSSNIYAQTNWWTPILPITRERTIALYPAYWSRPLANTSATWDLERVREMPIVPRPTEPVDAESEVRIVIEPGDLLCFSGAHLHASIPIPRAPPASASSFAPSPPRTSKPDAARPTSTAKPHGWPGGGSRASPRAPRWPSWPSRGHEPEPPETIAARRQREPELRRSRRPEWAATDRRAGGGEDRVGDPPRCVSGRPPAENGDAGVASF